MDSRIRRVSSRWKVVYTFIGYPVGAFSTARPNSVARLIIGRSFPGFLLQLVISIYLMYARTSSGHNSSTIIIPHLHPLLRRLCVNSLSLPPSPSISPVSATSDLSLSGRRSISRLPEPTTFSGLRPRLAPPSWRVHAGLQISSLSFVSYDESANDIVLDARLTLLHYLSTRLHALWYTNMLLAFARSGPDTASPCPGSASSRPLGFLSRRRRCLRIVSGQTRS